MVELKLESIEEQDLPRDCFISVRVGETQKLSRLAATRVYRFPQAGDRRYGKIEVFRRIGACSVDIDPTVMGTREVAISCADAGFGGLGLRIGVEPDEESKKKVEDPLDGSSKKAGTKVKAAKEYLSKHGLEVRLSEAMQAVLRERPDNPTEYLAYRLLGAQPGSGGNMLPPLQGLNRQEGPGMPAYQQDRSIPMDDPWKPQPKAQNRPRQLEPLPGSQSQQAMSKVEKPPQAAPSVAVVPFGKSYYSKHFLSMPNKDFQSIYSKFPPAKRAAPKAPAAAAVLPFRAYYKANFQGSGGGGAFSKMYPNFPKAAKQPQKNWLLGKDSVKDVLPFLPYYNANAIKAPAFNYKAFPAYTEAMKKAAPPSSSTAWKPAFTSKPSVGTWLMFKPPQVKPPAWNLKPSVGTWIGGLPLYEGGKKVAPVAAQLKSQQAKSNQVAAPFGQSASVGTWLMHRNVSKVEMLRSKANALLFRANIDGSLQRALEQMAKRDGNKSGASTSAVSGPSAKSKADTESFEFRPSVGSWLGRQRQPPTKKLAPQHKSFQFRPSVGSWLAVRLPPEPEPPKPMALSSRVMLGPSFYSMGIRPGIRIL